MEAAKFLGVSKEAIYNRLRRGSLNSVVEEGIKYIVLQQNTSKEPKIRKSDTHQQQDSAYVDLLKAQVEELKLKNEKLELDKEKLIADKERMLIESKEKIEMIYKERDEQLKTILSLASRQIGHSSDITPPNTNRQTEDYVFEPQMSPVEEADVMEHDEEEELEEPISVYSDSRDLRSYLKEKGFSKKEKRHINDELSKKAHQLHNVMDKDGKIYIKKGKKLKEILGD